jgi:nucleoside-diphosphate-sugar epimerase
VDITDGEALRQLVRQTRPEFLINYAARADISFSARATDYRPNIDGVANLLRVVREAGTIRRAIWISTQLVSRVGRVPVTDTDYGPDTTYGDSKVVTELMVRLLDGGGIEWVIGRPTTVWGPGMSDHYLTLLKYLERGLYFHIGSAPNPKSFSFIYNSAFQVERLLFADRQLVHARTFYLADYQPIDLRSWCNSLAREMGARPPITIPVWTGRLLARAGDILNATVQPSFKLNSFRLRNILTPYVFDVSELERVTGPLPYSFDESIRSTVNWYRGLNSSGGTRV